jgi:predicted RNase H-like HicB family nuclease
VAKPTFSVRIDHDAGDGLYYATCLDLQGCHTSGKTRAAAIASIKEVILDHLQARLTVRPATAAMRGGLPAGSEIVEIAA